jgi:hypothetical protein
MQGFECLGCSLRTHWGRSQGGSCSPSHPPLTFSLSARGCEFVWFGGVLMIASDKLAAPIATEQISGQIVSVCMALGVSREHTELVMRVMAACTNQAAAGAGQGL